MGRIECTTIYVWCSEEYRLVRVYLPDSYDVEPKKEYPVLFMQDGQNIFEDETATYGHSWNLKRYLTESKKELIVVGLDNSSTKRYDEYSPWECECKKSSFIETKKYGGNGEAYARFFVETLLPWVKERYRISSKREDCSIAGSSMGGFITAYIAATYPEYFANVGVFSIASWFAEEAFLNYMRDQDLKRMQQYYLYVGTEESSDEEWFNMKETYVKNTWNYKVALGYCNIPEERITYQIGEGEHHNEQAWERYIIEFLFLL